VIARRAICLSGGLGMLAACLRSHAQPLKSIRRVGLIFFSTELGWAPYREAFVQGMRELGWEEGKGVTYLSVYANGDVTRLKALASDLIKKNVDAIVVSDSPTAHAAQEETSTVPIVFVGLSNVVGNGYVASLARPGGNVTGVASQFEEVLVKLIEVLHAIVPHARRIAVLVNENNLSHAAFWNAAQNACGALDLVASRFVANSRSQFAPAVEDMVRVRSEAVVVSNDFLFGSERVGLHELLESAHLPDAYGYRGHVFAGGLLSYGSNLVASYAQAARYVDRILRGAKPADLPVEQPTKFELIVNQKSASALGLTIPQSVLLRADEVIR